MKFLSKLLSVFLIAPNSYGAIFSSTAIIPNPYKIERSGHLNGSAAARNKQSLAGGYITSGESKSQSSGLESVDDSTSFNAFAYQHYTPVTIELKFGKEETKDDIAPITEDEDTDIDVLIGAVLPNSPVSIGFDYSTFKSVSTTSGISSTSKSKSIGLNTSIELNDGLYLGAGASQSKDDPTGSTDGKDEEFYLGLGKVSNILAGETLLGFINEEGVKNYILVTQGAVPRGNNQILGEFIYTHAKDNNSNDKFTGLFLSAGYFMDLTGFYIQPELGLQKFDIKSSGFDTDSSTLLASIEAGIKNDKMSLFFKVGKDSGDAESAGASDTELSNTEIELGLQLYF